MKNIAIIGGGFTGLVAARRLQAEGHKITIFESGPELGGLAASFRVEGIPLEKAYHHLFRTDRDILSLIEELGENERLDWRPSSVAIYRDGRLWSFMSAIDLIRFGACSFAGRIRTGLVALYLKKTKNWKSLEGHSAFLWMKSRCGESATNAIWGPLLKGKFAYHAGSVSMAWLWARLHVRSNSREPGEGEKLGYIKGGFVELINALEKQLLEGGAEIHRSCPVEAIESSLEGPRLRISGKVEAYDAALFTGSGKAFLKLTDGAAGMDAYKKQLQSIDYLGAMCHVFTTDQNLGDHYWINVNEDDAPFLVFIQHTNLIPTTEYNGKHVYYIGAYLDQAKGRFLETEENILREWHSYLKRMYPAFEPDRIKDSYLFRFRDAQHIVDTKYQVKIPSYETSMKGVFLANFSQIYPEDRGTNFAVREGNSVSTLIESFLNRTP